MTNRLIKVPILTYVPEVRAVQGSPAFCETRLIFAGYKVQPSSVAFLTVDDLRRLKATGIPTNSSPVVNAQGKIIGYQLYFPAPASSRVPLYQEVRKCYPGTEAVAGVPGRVDKSGDNAWNSGARSISKVPVGSYAAVDIPSAFSGAVLFGLSDGQYDHTYYHPSHALVARPTGITAVERGTAVSDVNPTATRLMLVRSADSVSFFADTELIHTSNNAIIGDAYADATLYSLSNYVDNPVIGRYIEASGVSTVELVTGVGSGTRGTAELAMEVAGAVEVNGLTMIAGTVSLSMTVSASPSLEQQVRGTAELSAEAECAGFLAFGYDQPARQVGVLSAVGKIGLKGFAAVKDDRVTRAFYARSIVPIPIIHISFGQQIESKPIEARGVLFPGAISSKISTIAHWSALPVTLSLAGKASLDEYIGAAGLVPPPSITSWFSYLPSNQLDASQMVVTADYWSMDSILLFAMQESLSLTDEMSMYALLPFELMESMGISSSITLQGLIQMAISEKMSISSDIYSSQRQAIQYAVNSKSYALSRYSGMGFTKFVRVCDETYGVNSEGLCRIGHDTDDGDTINAMIDFGATDYGTSRAKRMNSIYAGIATDGCVYLRVTGDGGKEQVYRTVESSGTARAMTAKGLSARHWRVRLELWDASFADLSDIEVEIGVSQRRLRQ